MGYDRGDSFPFDFEPNRISSGSKSKGKLSLRSYLIQCERRWKYSFLSAWSDWHLSASWRSYRALKRPPQTAQTSRHYGVEGLQGALNWATIVPRGASFSDDRWWIFQSGSCILSNIFLVEIFIFLIFFLILTQETQGKQVPRRDAVHNFKFYFRKL